ncbi:hypothetical protein DFO73_101574 [Cytobacillus oceanisediminis]|uniref:Uncharacterized protein n=1 Tax=Cytobacillus oceanisediminis TaxID=665099 RepID=A0A2V3A8B1_9BACI|nr:EcoRII N-terminal effector-binding domain-containing protein [Cytobacillus oceanisediminis]PWW32310.1 hypothetical protein DFO73_101574 [Cytobacillus oceanisediminis]
MEHIFTSKLIGLVIKRLSNVEVNKQKSNQHEFNGNKDLKKLLGPQKISNKDVSFILYKEDDNEVATSSKITWYDAREAHPTRTEYRLYFKSNIVMDHAEAGDLLVVSKHTDEDINFIVVKQGSTAETVLNSLFGPVQGTSFTFKSLD